MQIKYFSLFFILLSLVVISLVFQISFSSNHLMLNSAEKNISSQNTSNTQTNTFFNTKNLNKTNTNYSLKSFTVDYSYPKYVQLYTYARPNYTYKQPIHIHNTKYPQNTLLAMIHTLPSHLVHIKNTRQTWCQRNYQDIFGFKCLFILVNKTVEDYDNTHPKENIFKTLLTMNSTYNDIYLIDMPGLQESWTTLQQKNIAAYTQIYPLYTSYKFYARVDDCVMVNVEMLMDVLNEIPSNNTVVGDFWNHAPWKEPGKKYYDKLASRYSLYYTFPSGYFSIFSNDITHFFADWDKYYNIAPSSLEDPGFGFLIWKYTKENNMKVNLIKPKLWGGQIKAKYGNYIVFHGMIGEMNQIDFYDRSIKDGHFVN
ncbi:hypothetical protein EIN_200820 [Entamoeba invadens IP1]|uniref:Hexosyltransferase n=1 Tax=Entamoeba invadens IP1 TaxID=370355 RepID=L7FJA7_ENTIV|nr:hypothetical protein EIN_200820 [Entamoeba invadens IP1]ELP83644.1 hypothetical protein EIN_200820 [Entamoeba invadens IP1]|eukprot:XP_004182990.1 hypothetical protein EIN_200820 [Entamoeba invadens IP1]